MAEITGVTNQRNFSESSLKIPGERPKTPEEVRIINILLKSVPVFARKYHAQDHPIAPRAIHFMETSDNLIESADCDPVKNKITVYSTANQERPPSPLALALQISHELMHFYAFKRYDVTSDEGKLASRRDGLAIKGDRNSTFGFQRLNEGLTEELNKRYDYWYLSKTRSPILEHELSKRNNARLFYREDIGKEESGDIAFIDEQRKLLIKYGYPFERAVVRLLVSEIFTKQTSYFKRQEDVFTVFAKAYFSGQILDLVRLVESSFGKGSFHDLYTIGEKLLFANEEEAPVRNIPYE